MCCDAHWVIFHILILSKVATTKCQLLLILLTHLQGMTINLKHFHIFLYYLLNYVTNNAKWTPYTIVGE